MCIKRYSALRSEIPSRKGIPRHRKYQLMSGSPSSSSVLSIEQSIPNESTCTLCDEPMRKGIDDIVVVRERGLQTFIIKSEQRKDDKWKSWTGKSTINFHKVCRYRYSSLPSTPPSMEGMTDADIHRLILKLPLPIPDDTHNFKFSGICFICGKPRSQKPGCSLGHKHTQYRMIDVGIRRNDELGIAVASRLRGITTLESVDAFYHKKCYGILFRSPSLEPNPPEADASFQRVTRYIEDSGKFKFDILELRQVMGDAILSYDVLRRRLADKYGKGIHILKLPGKQPTIHYKTFESKTCTD